MDPRPISDADRELITAATETLEAHFEPGRHRTACGLRTTSGEIYTSINLIAPTGPAQVHCEPIAVGMAVLDNETALETSVAVTYPADDPTREPRVISACGVCRELFWSHSPGIDVIIPGDDEPVKATLSEILPAKD